MGKNYNSRMEIFTALLGKILQRGDVRLGKFNGESGVSNGVISRRIARLIMIIGVAGRGRRKAVARRRRD